MGTVGPVINETTNPPLSNEDLKKTIGRPQFRRRTHPVIKPFSRKSHGIHPLLLAILCIGLSDWDPHLDSLGSRTTLAHDRPRYQIFLGKPLRQSVRSKFPSKIALRTQLVACSRSLSVTSGQIVATSRGRLRGRGRPSQERWSLCSSLPIYSHRSASATKSSGISTTRRRFGRLAISPPYSHR